MNKKTRTLKNLAISIMIAIVGLLVTILSFKILGFRYDVGYEVPRTVLMSYIKAFGVIVLENGTMIIGVCLMSLGIIGTYNNIMKLAR